MKTRIHVNQHAVKRNAKTGSREPVITVRNYRGVVRCRRVEVLGTSTVVYSPDRPLSCGAKVWIETTAEVVVD